MVNGYGFGVSDEAEDAGPEEAGEQGAALAFPRIQQQAESVTLTRQATFRAWVGRPERLLRLQELAEDALERVYSEHLAMYTGADRAGYAEWLGENLRLRVEIRGAGGAVRRSGDIASLLAEMDSRDIESILFNNADSSLSERVVIGLHASPPVEVASDPIKVTVKGADRQWVGGVFDTLSSELAKDVPGWAWIRRASVSFWIGTLVAIGIMGAALYWADGSQEFLAESGWFGLSVMFFILAFGLGGVFGGLAVVRSILHYLFPSLEVVVAGSDSQARRVGGIAFAAVSTLASLAGLVLGLFAL